jgi:hypothetical protein
MIGLEIDAAPERDVEILEGDGEPVRALERLQPGGVRGGRRIEPDAREIGLEVDGDLRWLARYFVQGPISFALTLAVIFMLPSPLRTMCDVAA